MVLIEIMLANKYYIGLSASIMSTTTFTTGPHSGQTGNCSIVLAIPDESGTRQFIDGDYISTSHSGFLNLNNCVHGSLNGCLLATPVVNVLKLTSTNNVFGPWYLLNDYIYLTDLTFQDKVIRKSVFGTYGSGKEGNWWFLAGVRKVGPNQYFTALGYWDLEGGSTNPGKITVTLTDCYLVNGYRYLRSTTKWTSYRTSLYDFDEVYNATYAEMRTELDAKTMRPYEISLLGNAIIRGSKVLTVPKRLSLDDATIFPLSDRNPDWAELARRAYNNVSFFSGNGLALFKDCAEMSASARQTGKLIQSLLARKKPASVIAKLFLAFHYGWKLLASDLKSFNDDLTKFNSLSSPYQKCSSGSTFESHGASYTAYYHCYYERYGRLKSLLDQFISFADLELTLDNIWDLIPYSFVVDWFFNIGDMLESMSSYYHMTQEHRVICTGRSIKCTRHVEARQLGLNGLAGTVSAKYYHREYAAELISPSFFLATKPKPFEHFIEGGALIVSKR